MKVIVTTRCLACMLANCGSGGSFSFGWKSSKRASQTRAESSQSAPLVSEQESMTNQPITLEGSPTTPFLEEFRAMNQLHTSGFLADRVKSSLETQPDNADHRTSIESQHALKSTSSAPNESIGAANSSTGGAFKSATQATWSVSFQPKEPLWKDDSKAMKGTGQWMTVSIPLDARKKGYLFRLRTMEDSSVQTTREAERTHDLLDSMAPAW